MHVWQPGADGSAVYVIGSSPSKAATAPTGSKGARSGQLDLIIGPMFAGKTSSLLRKVQQLEVGTSRLVHGMQPLGCTCMMQELRVETSQCVSQAQGLAVAVIKSAKDTRYHASRLTTHDGQSRVHSHPIMPNHRCQRMADAGRVD